MLSPVGNCVVKYTCSSFPLKLLNYITERLVPELNGNALDIERNVSLAGCAVCW